MTKEELWQATLAEIELNISKANYTTWFRNTLISSRNNGSVVVSVPNNFSKEWLENKFNKLILRTIRGLSPETKEVSFVIGAKKLLSAAPPHNKAHKIPSSEPTTSDQLSFEQLNINKETNLNPKYTFDNYIIGSSNELAHAAALSIAEKPGMEYNPFFVYGGVGLGKTHLLQALGNSLKLKHADIKIHYLTAEKFTNDFIAAVQNQTLKSFREIYRKSDVLLIDDIQFIAHKERTQEEFFHTFNTLYENNKQVILSSDRPPRALEFIEERLKSRFEGGMLVDVGFPEYEMRVEILKTKAKEKKVPISDEVIQYIAGHIQHNIRELEGTLNILAAFYKRGGPEITIEKAKKHLDHIIKRPRRVVSLKKILKIAADFYDIAEKDILSQNRKREISHPRQVIMYLLRDELKYSYPLIGSKLGGRDHTTVIHACVKITEELKRNNEQLAEELNFLKREIYSS